MYSFTDTMEASQGATLPSEALKINGEYIENFMYQEENHLLQS